MLPIGHAAGGYLVGAVLARATQSNSARSRTMRLLGTLGGLLPDLDLVVYNLARKPLGLTSDVRHHTWLTHTLPFYLLPAGLLTAWANRTHRAEIAISITTFTAGACAHLIQDMCGSGDGLQLFFPLSRRMFGIRLLNVHGKEWRRRYLRDPIFLVEVALISMASVHLLRGNYRMTNVRR